MSKFQTNQESINEVERRSLAWRDSAVVFFLLFIALMAGSAATARPGEPVSTQGIIWIVASFVAITALIGALFASYRRADERQQLIWLKASALTLGAVMFCLFAAELLYALNLVSLPIAIQSILGGGIVLWNFLLGVIERRSRP